MKIDCDYRHGKPLQTDRWVVLFFGAPFFARHFFAFIASVLSSLFVHDDYRGICGFMTRNVLLCTRHGWVG